MKAPLIWRLLDRIGWAQLIFGQMNGQRTLYLARLPLTPMTPWGQLLFHTFYRGDEDPDPHDHPWAFWTLPLGTGYWEQVMQRDGSLEMNHVPAWKWSWRDFTYTHRVLYPDTGIDGMFVLPITTWDESERDRYAAWPMRTLVWRGPYKKFTWGFWVKGNSPMFDRIGWFAQSNPVTQGGVGPEARMKIPWRTYIFGEEQTEAI